MLDKTQYTFNDKDFFKKPFCNLIHGDCTEAVRMLPLESIDMIMFSPSYYGLRDYHVEGQIGLEDHPDKYIKRLVDLCHYLKLVLKKSGNMYVVIGDSYFGHHGGGPSKFERESKGLTWKDKSKRYRTKPFSHVKFGGWLRPKQLMLMPARLAIALQEDGWTLRNDICWHKPNSTPCSAKDRLANYHEHIFHFVKSRKYYYDLDAIRVPYKKSSIQRSKYIRTKFSSDPNEPLVKFPKSSVTGTEKVKIKQNPKGCNPGDVWNISTVRKSRGHYASYPQKLCVSPISSSSPEHGVILDPMCGSGTTLKVARDLHRNAIGIDLNKSYIELSKNRLEMEGYNVKLYDVNLGE